MDSGRDPAPPWAVSMAAPVNWFQGETPPSTCACVPQVRPHRGLPEAPLWAWRWCPMGPFSQLKCYPLNFRQQKFSGNILGTQDKATLHFIPMLD